jgi:Zn-dependent M28 family amino/carboxypeptidase
MSRRRRWLVAGILILGGTAKAAEGPAPSPTALMAHVRFLCSPALQGRSAGTPGEATAASYVTEHLRRLGLTPHRQGFLAPAGTSRNVYARIAGRREDEVVVVGAHLDHLGMQNGKLHPGASDDASGVAAVLEIARALSTQPLQPERTVLIVFFGAEEIALLGSRHFVAEPPEPIAHMVAMVNVDSIGRPLGDRWFLAPLTSVLGVDRRRGTGLLGTRQRPGLRALADAAFAKVGDQVLAAEDLPDTIGDEVERQSVGRGDSAPFDGVGVPTLFFSEGESSDYHAPGDTPERLNPELLARRTTALLDIVRRLANAPHEQFALVSDAPAKRKPPSGLYLPMGITTGASFGASVNAYVGAEASAVYLWRTLFWLGAYVDVNRALGASAWRVGAGPELGYKLLGLDGGYVEERSGARRRRGGAVRAVLGGAPVALVCRGGALGGDFFMEVGLLLKWPFALTAR